MNLWEKMDKSESMKHSSQSNYERNIFMSTMSLEVKAPVSIEHSHSYKYFCDGEYNQMSIFEQGTIRLYQEALQKLLQEYKLEIELYQEKINTKISSKNGKFQDILTIFTKHKSRLQVLFHILKRLLLWYSQRKVIRNGFVKLKIYAEKKAYYRRMNIYCRNLYKRRLLRKHMKKWNQFKNEGLKTKYTYQFTMRLSQEMELLKQEYGAIIINLQGVLQKKIQERDEEIRAHEELFARFANINDIKKA